MERKVNVIKDLDGKDIVFINDIRFKGRQNIDWEDVKKYLEEFVGEFYSIADTEDIVYIGKDFPDEYSSSKYTYSLKGTLAKAKANAAQGIPEIVEIADTRAFHENRKDKHLWDARFGWYRYNSRFALPIYGPNGEIDRYNVFSVSLVIRRDKNGKLYLYDVVNIRKEAGNPLEP
jgi:hypothetical protein